MEKTYYETLEINKTADKKEIKKAFKNLAKKYHPDRNTGDDSAEAKFKEINEAYQVLSDDEKRGMYDRFGKDGLQGASRGGNSGFASSEFFDDIFGNFFGGGGGGRRSQRTQYKYSQDLEVPVKMSFHEAIFGAKKNISFQYKTACDPCGGTGADGAQLKTCSTCGGNGQMHIRQGFMTISQTCSSCHGAGSMPSKSCGNCKGNGYIAKSEKLALNIPEGVNSGNRIRVGGKGNILPRAGRGDLYLSIEVKEDEHFIRDGNDIYLEVPIFFTNILLSKKIKVPSIKGEVEIKLHPKIKDKEHIVFRNAGVKDVNSHNKGNFIVQTKILYPKSISSEQTELLNKLHESFSISEDNNFMSSIVDNMKSWFK